MRLHHLAVTAFGPFAGREEVDFDELCDAGLFLLTGPTGAGKTTILDAVCFALYGSVPGVRGVKALKSQHAPDDARPEVVLAFSVRDRRFVVRRTPEWSRPKRRGSGFTTENASATLVETTSGQDHLLSSRAQEVGHFIGELIGMQSTQFVQVAMLPQGDFQKFLRASSQDRHEVLQHLFRTDRFSRIEEWVHEHSRVLRERSAAGEAQVVRVLDTVADRAGLELPEDVRERPLAWADDVIEVAAVAHLSAAEQHRQATMAASEARTRHQDGLRKSAAIERRDQAHRTLDELARGSASAEEARRRLQSDDRASRCLPLLTMLDTAMTDRDRAAGAWSGAEDRLRHLDLDGLSLPEPLTSEGLAELEQRVRGKATGLEALLPREHELIEARGSLAECERELEARTAEHAAVVARCAAIPAALASARECVATLAAVAHRVEALSLELGQAEQQLEAAMAAEKCAETLSRLRDDERGARDAAADARDRLQDVTARRLSGIAAELAGRLEDGRPCQVCGSAVHPRPAEATADAVTEAEQAEAAARYESLSAAHAEARGRVLQAEERLAAHRQACGGRTALACREIVEAAANRLREARDAAVQLVDAESAVDALAREDQELTVSAHQLATRVATVTQAVDADRRTIAALEGELAAATGTPPGETVAPLAGRVTHLVELADVLGGVREALCDREAAVRRVVELEAHVESTAREHGFTDVASLRAAVLDPTDRAGLDELLEARAEAEARARAVLEDDDVRALPELGVPDVLALADALTTAEEREAAATKALHRCEEVLEGLRRHRRRLEEALTVWAPAHAEYLRADSMAKLVRGMGGDNQLQMRLSAYVLATRLDQVVAAANERLAHMRDQRYLLQRTGRAARKGAQAGLGLEVVDQWTGDVRDPATLSGGETFVVSLALALGLADVVTQEAGGTEIETLFVDEGFGTLDADTLDDVMDRLDDLRAGGRAVGVVSHVSEMRNRIPTQLHVEKRRNGSTVALRTAVG
jgi:exonuclease SbcC